VLLVYYYVYYNLNILFYISQAHNCILLVQVISRKEREEILCAVVPVQDNKCLFVAGIFIIAVIKFAASSSTHYFVNSCYAASGFVKCWSLLWLFCHQLTVRI